jgi:hypothetical protein
VLLKWYLPSKYKALSSNSLLPLKRKKEGKKEERKKIKKKNQKTMMSHGAACLSCNHNTRETKAGGL